MSRRAATPVRFDDAVAARLQAFVAARPGMSLSAAANLLVDEGLRTIEHPGVVFRDGPSGRRAGLVGGPDVWEIVRAVRSARAAEPELAEDEILPLVTANTGVHDRLLRTALRYWSSHPHEIDAEVAAGDGADRVAELAWQRQHDLLVG